MKNVKNKSLTRFTYELQNVTACEYNLTSEINDTIEGSLN